MTTTRNKDLSPALWRRLIETWKKL